MQRLASMDQMVRLKFFALIKTGTPSRGLSNNMVIELSSCTLNVNPVRLDVIQCSEEEISIQRILIRGHQEQMKLHKQLEIRQIAH